MKVPTDGKVTPKEWGAEWVPGGGGLLAAFAHRVTAAADFIPS